MRVSKLRISVLSLGFTMVGFRVSGESLGFWVRAQSSGLGFGFRVRG